MKRTTVLLPAELKNRAEQSAGRLGISLGELIREALAERLLALDRPRSEDPLFKEPAYFHGPAPSDIAENHDDYLYEGED
jgi:hypothetical protein